MAKWLSEYEEENDPKTEEKNELAPSARFVEKATSSTKQRRFVWVYEGTV
jgi:hypothetical protein